METEPSPLACNTTQLDKNQQTMPDVKISMLPTSYDASSTEESEERSETKHRITESIHVRAPALNDVIESCHSELMGIDEYVSIHHTTFDHLLISRNAFIDGEYRLHIVLNGDSMRTIQDKESQLPNEFLQAEDVFINRLVTASLHISSWIFSNAHLPSSVVDELRRKVSHCTAILVIAFVSKLIELSTVGENTNETVHVIETICRLEKSRLGKIYDLTETQNYLCDESEHFLPGWLEKEVIQYLSEFAMPPKTVLKFINNLFRSRSVFFSVGFDSKFHTFYQRNAPMEGRSILQEFSRLINKLTLRQNRSDIQYIYGGAEIKMRKWCIIAAWLYTAFAIAISVSTSVLNWGKRDNLFERSFDCIQTLTFLLLSVFGLIKLTSEDENAIRNTLLGRKRIRDAESMVRSLCVESQSMLVSEFAVRGIAAPWLNAQHCRVLDTTLCTGDMHFDRPTLIEDMLECGAILTGRAILFGKSYTNPDKLRCVPIVGLNPQTIRADNVYYISAFVPNAI